MTDQKKPAPGPVKIQMKPTDALGRIQGQFNNNRQEMIGRINRANIHLNDAEGLFRLSIGTPLDTDRRIAKARQMCNAGSMYFSAGNAVSCVIDYILREENMICKGYCAVFPKQAGDLDEWLRGFRQGVDFLQEQDDISDLHALTAKVGRKRSEAWMRLPRPRPPFPSAADEPQEPSS